MSFDKILERACRGDRLSVAEIAALLNAPGKAEEHALFDAAYALKCQLLGKVVNLRGLIEFSNICTRIASIAGYAKAI